MKLITHNGILIPEAGEYLIKYYERGDEEVIRLTLSELAEVLNTGTFEDENLSWIALDLDIGTITYTFLTGEWIAEDDDDDD